MNINTSDYWTNRFATGSWTQHGGKNQTRHFAKAQVKRLNLAPDFAGTIVDFGCATGDAFPVYRAAFPNAKLIGVDFASSAIEQARQQYGDFAEFICGSVAEVPRCDVISASNVLEHIDNDRQITLDLKRRCERLFVFVPYKEWPLDPEHVRCYDRDYYRAFGIRRREIFFCRGWTEMGRGLVRKGFANIGNIIRGDQLYRINRQIMFEM